MIDTQTQQEVVKTSLNSVSEKHPMVAFGLVILLSGGISGGTSMFGNAELDKRVAAIETKQEIQTVTMTTMQKQQEKLDITLNEMNKTLTQLNITMASMTATVEALKK